MVFVDDGSTDGSWAILGELTELDGRLSAIRLSRNFGHQVAVSLGLDRATGAAVVVMDADMQDPPEVVLAMAAEWRNGFDVVYGQRVERQLDSRFKRVTAAGFYRVLNALSSVEIPEQVGDFRLVDRAVVDAIRAMPEHNRYVRGMFAWLGFSQIAVPYSRPARWAGSTSYSVKRMLRLATDGVVGDSKAPLRAPLLVGAITTGAAALSGVYASVASTSGGRRRTTPAVNVGALLAGVQLMALGVLAEYLAVPMGIVLGKPLYVLSTKPPRIGPER